MSGGRLVVKSADDCLVVRSNRGVALFLAVSSGMRQRIRGKWIVAIHLSPAVSGVSFY